MLGLPMAAQGEDAIGRCTYSADGTEVRCAAPAFHVLMDELTRIETERRLALTREGELAAKLRILDGELTTCRREVCPVAAPPDPMRPMLGLGAGVLGTLGLIAALGLDVPTEARFSIGAAGLASIGAGVWLVLP